MSVTVLTQRALERVAAGATMNFAGSDLFAVRQSDGTGPRAIYTRGDTPEDRLVIVAAGGDTSVMPDALRDYRGAAYQRMISFSQRAERLPLVVPKGWKQYKHDNLVTFFALPEALRSTMRWIAEVRISGSRDIAFWELTDSEDQQDLEDYTPDHEIYAEAREWWLAQRNVGLSALSGPVEASLGVDVILDGAQHPQTVDRNRTFSQWMPELTEFQKDFVEAPTGKSIRLRGPAGSGKTLTMCLKAVHEVVCARDSALPLRILFVTHSWSLAGEVDRLVSALSGSSQSRV